MPSSSVTDWNFAYVFPLPERERYWTLTGLALVQIFDSSFPIAALRQRIETSPVEEQIVFFHQTPLILAAQLCNVELTERHAKKYEALSLRL